MVGVPAPGLTDAAAGQCLAEGREALSGDGDHGGIIARVGSSGHRGDHPQTAVTLVLCPRVLCRNSRQDSCGD